MIGIHTLTLRLDIDDSCVWHTLRRDLGLRSYGQYCHAGVTWFRFWQHVESGKRLLFVQIDPALMLGHVRFSITSFKDIKWHLPRVFCQWFESRSRVAVPSILAWQVQRIDFAVDVRCESQEIADAYATMACNGRLPRYLSTKYAGTTHNLHVKNKRECFQVYAKQRQIQDRHPDASPEILRCYSGVVRCEVQLNRAKIKSIAKENGFGGYTLNHFLDDELATSLITRRLEEIAGPAGEHRTLTSAKQRLAALRTNARVSAVWAAKLSAFLDFVFRHVSLEAARNACQCGVGIVKSIATFDSRVRDLADKGIALPCIPQQCQVSRLPRLADVFQTIITAAAANKRFIVDITQLRSLFNKVRCINGNSAVSSSIQKDRRSYCRKPVGYIGSFGIPPPVLAVEAAIR